MLALWADMGMTSRTFAVAIATSVILAAITPDRRVRWLAALCFFGFSTSITSAWASELAELQRLEKEHTQILKHGVDWFVGIVKFIGLTLLLGRSADEVLATYHGPRRIDEHTWIVGPFFLEGAMVLLMLWEFGVWLSPWAELEPSRSRIIFTGSKLGLELLFLWGRVASIHHRPLGRWFGRQMASANQAVARMGLGAQQAAHQHSARLKGHGVGVFTFHGMAERFAGRISNDTVKRPKADEVGQCHIGLQGSFLTHPN